MISIDLMKYCAYLTLATVLIVADQFSKQWAFDALAGKTIEILPVFNLTLVFNSGAAFGFLSSAGGWQSYLFIALAIIFSIGLLAYLWAKRDSNRWESLGLTLLLAGAVGNMIDRILHDYVIDFVVLHYQDWYFPAFNIADACITLGAIMLIWHSLFADR